MKKLNFAHISDTHLVGADSSDFVKELSPSPWINLERCLGELAQMPLDFVLHTGDITHEGSAEDYARARALFEKYLPGVPIVFALGNHDIRENFRAGYMNQSPAASPFSSVNNISGLRIIAIDTSMNKKSMIGEILDSQMDFIEENILQKSERGTIIIMHVPPVSVIPSLQMPLPKRFLELIARNEIIGVFAGHMHSNLICNICKKPLFVASSLAFSIEYCNITHTAKYTGLCAYNICTLCEDGFTSHTKIIEPQMRVLQEKGLE